MTVLAVALWVVAALVFVFAFEAAVAWLWLRHEIRRLDRLDDHNESMKGRDD